MLTSYVTPYKVAIVALIILYCENEVPASHRIELMSRILPFVDGDAVLDGDIHDLEKLVEGIPARYGSLYQLLLERLWQIRCLDDLDSFVSSTDSYTRGSEDGEVAKIKPSSILGTYFRKCFLAFDELSFHRVSQLWDAYQAFLEPSRHQIPDQFLPVPTRSPLAESTDRISGIELPKSLMNSNNNNNNKNNVSMVSEQNLSSVMEGYAKDPANGQTNDDVKKVLDSLNSLSEKELLPPPVHYVKYLYASKECDYETAFECLHRYYDYAMDNRGRTDYQYALFSLAKLQAEFGAHNEALKAAQEAISVARENYDVDCLTRILAWVYSILSKNPSLQPPESLASKEQIAHFLRTKSGEVSLVLQAQSYLDHAQSAMVSSEPLVEVFESIVKSYHTTLKSDSRSKPNELNLVQAKLWSRLGVGPLATLFLSSATPGVVRARHFLIQGKPLLAIEALNSCKHKLLQEDQKQWLPAYTLLQCEIALSQHQLVDARRLVRQLMSLSWIDADTAEEANMCQIRLYMLSGEESLAAQTISFRLQSTIDRGMDVSYQIRYLLLQIRLLCNTGAPSRALSLAIRALLLAEKASLVVLALEALVLLASILTHMNYKNDALDLLDWAMPRILETDNAQLIDEAYKTLTAAGHVPS
uniref:Anaphase-promoting complex subunit 5 n=1 Tax=Blastobotrys adeninivorans TaxID=409370 RepID=A0A060TA01_BLAAD